jgi:molybdate transport system substrate-binding protein
MLSALMFTSLLLGSSCNSPNSSSPQSDAPTVFAAASTREALTRIARAFEAETGIRPRLSFGASSTLARQITQGAPARLFLSANVAWMDDLERRNLIDPSSRIDLLSNRLALIATKESPEMTMDIQTATVPDQLKHARIAMADPDHVPAGIYARAALRHLKWWPKLRGNLLTASDVRAALRIVALGEADYGIVYASDAQAGKSVRMLATFPAQSHPPIRYPVALLRNAGETAKAFHGYLQTATAKQVFKEHGFIPLPSLD